MVFLPVWDGDQSGLRWWAFRTELRRTRELLAELPSWSPVSSAASSSVGRALQARYTRHFKFKVHDLAVQYACISWLYFHGFRHAAVPAGLRFSHGHHTLLCLPACVSPAVILSSQWRAYVHRWEWTVRHPTTRASRTARLACCCRNWSKRRAWSPTRTWSLTRYAPPLSQRRSSLHDGMLNLRPPSFGLSPLTGIRYINKKPELILTRFRQFCIHSHEDLVRPLANCTKCFSTTKGTKQPGWALRSTSLNVDWSPSGYVLIWQI